MLASSRGWFVLLVVLGPLIGLAQASPGDGIIASTFGAYAFAAALLLPFVAVRLVSPEKHSGALKLLLQARVSLGAMLCVKLLVLLLAWVVAWIPGMIALALWHLYGGQLAVPALAGAALGDVLWATLVCSTAIAAASFTDNAATAAIVTLAGTIGTWLLDFVARRQGGMAQMLDAFTPESALRALQNGEIRLAIVLAALVLSIGFLVLAAVWLHPGRRRRTPVIATAVILAATSMLLWLGAQTSTSWDMTKDYPAMISGYPLLAHPVWAPLIFWLAWPGAVLATWLGTRRVSRAPSEKNQAADRQTRAVCNL